MTDTRSLAEGIVAAVGGPPNICSVGHCTTRLRLVLADRSAASRDAVTAVPGIMSAVERGGQLQIVIGHQVAEVDEQVRAIVAESGGPALGAAPQLSAVDRAFDLFAGTFQPLLWALVGASMVRTLLALLMRLDWIDPTSGTYGVLAAAGNGVFVLLPVFVGITASLKLGANPYLGGAIGAALVDGTLTSLGEPGTRLAFLGIPTTVVDYTSSVFPALFAAVALAWLQPRLRRMLPADLHLVAVPFLCLMILVPATILIFGPIGTTLGEVIATVITWLNTFSPVLTGVLYASGFMFLVMLGLHWALVPVMVTSIANNGADPLVAYSGAYNFAIFGVALGVAVRTRDPALRQLGFSGLVTGLLAGISEPTVYGIILRYKRTLPILLAASALGGTVLGLAHARGSALVFSNVFTIPAFSPIAGYVLGILVAFASAAAMVVVLGYERLSDAAVPSSGNDGLDSSGEMTLGPGAGTSGAGTPGAGTRGEGQPPGPVGLLGPPAGQAGLLAVPAPSPPAEPASGESPAGSPNEQGASPSGRELVVSPMTGRVVPLTDVPDPVFARGLLGPGVAIEPSRGLVRAPVSGTVRSLTRTGHVVGLRSDSGLDLIIHVGIDTVHLPGEDFEPLVRLGQEVRAGDPLILFDLAAWRDRGVITLSPIVVANAASRGPMRVLALDQVVSGEPLIELPDRV